MLSGLHEALAGTSQVASIIISVAFMLLFGFAMTRITKLLKLPNVTAYILAGILIGPYCLGLVPQHIIDGMDFLSDIALAFIAFSTGEFFRFSTLKKSGAKVMVITVCEALLGLYRDILCPSTGSSLFHRVGGACLGNRARFNGHDHPPDRGKRRFR